VTILGLVPCKTPTSTEELPVSLSNNTFLPQSYKSLEVLTEEPADCSSACGLHSLSLALISWNNQFLQTFKELKEFESSQSWNMNSLI